MRGAAAGGVSSRPGRHRGFCCCNFTALQRIRRKSSSRQTLLSRRAHSVSRDCRSAIYPLSLFWAVHRFFVHLACGGPAELPPPAQVHTVHLESAVLLCNFPNTFDSSMSTGPSKAFPAAELGRSPALHTRQTPISTFILAEYFPRKQHHSSQKVGTVPRPAPRACCGAPTPGYAAG